MICVKITCTLHVNPTAYSLPTFIPILEYGHPEGEFNSVDQGTCRGGVQFNLWFKVMAANFLRLKGVLESRNASLPCQPSIFISN